MMDESGGGGFPSVKFEYLESQMDEFHPHRKITVLYENYDSSSLTFTFTVEVTDLATGESRVGTSVHCIEAYESGGDRQKSPNKIRKLMTNAKKAALTEAIRDAYAWFGIAADKYGMTGAIPMTSEQAERVTVLQGKVDNTTGNADKLVILRQWWDSQLIKIKKLSAHSADAFLDEIETKLNDALKKL